MQQKAPYKRAKVVYATVGDLMPMRCAPSVSSQTGREAFTIRAVGMLMRFPVPRERAKVVKAFDGRMPLAGGAGGAAAPCRPPRRRTTFELPRR